MFISPQSPLLDQRYRIALPFRGSPSALGPPSGIFRDRVAEDYRSERAAPDN
jgi:hypothetical protein